MFHVNVFTPRPNKNCREIAARCPHYFCQSMARETGRLRLEVSPRYCRVQALSQIQCSTWATSERASERREQRCCGYEAVPCIVPRKSKSAVLDNLVHGWILFYLSDCALLQPGHLTHKTRRLHLTQPLPFARLILVIGVSQYRTTVPLWRFDQHLQKSRSTDRPSLVVVVQSRTIFIASKTPCLPGSDVDALLAETYPSPGVFSRASCRNRVSCQE